MRALSIKEADVYLRSIGLGIGPWNQISKVGVQDDGITNSIKYAAPKGACELFCFSEHLAGWLPAGGWKIFQIDNSTWLTADEESFFCRLLCGPDGTPNLVENRTFIFEFDEDRRANIHLELLIAHLIYAFLLFECHGQVVSSNSTSGQLLSIQDGFVYFVAEKSERAAAESLLMNYENNPVKSPQWVLDIIAENQERVT